MGQAQNYIYIEDQYGLTQPEMQHSLKEALDRGLSYLVLVLAPALEQVRRATSLLRQALSRY